MPKAAPEIWEISGHEVRITSRDKPYWPDDGLTKGDMLAYYRAVASAMLPYLFHRPATMRAYPNGVRGPQFWRREKPDNAPDWLPYVTYQPETTETPIDVPVIDHEAALIWYADHSAIEFHMWLSLRNDLDHPDWAVFDLDPGESVPFEQVLQAALRVRDELERIDLRCFPKTSGGSGFHVFVPIQTKHSFDDVREWVHGVAKQLERQFPDEIAAASGGTHRGKIITIDHAQNSIARNTAAPYTLRARPGAPVSMPVTWKQVEASKIRPEQFTLRTVPDRLAQDGDAWAEARDISQSLPVES